MNEEKKVMNYGLLPQYALEGFDPNDVLVKIEGSDQDGNPVDYLYMECKTAQQWFYSVFPNGAINRKIDYQDDRKAVVSAYVFRDVNDSKYCASGTGIRYYSEDAIGKNYLNNAETAAIRKALANLGFCAPLDAHVTEHTVVRKREGDLLDGDEGGVFIPRPALPKTEEKASEKMAAKTEEASAAKEATPSPSVTPEGENAPENVAQTSAESSNKETANEPEPETRVPKKRGRKPRETKEAVATPVSKDANEVVEDTPVEAASQTATEPAPSNGPMTFEQAAAYRFPYGTCIGKTIAEAAQLKGNEFIRYHWERAEGEFKEALMTFCEFKGC